MLAVLPGLFLIFATTIIVFAIIKYTKVKYKKLVKIMGISVLAVMVIVFICEAVTYLNLSN